MKELSRRERQIMNVVYRERRVTAAEVHERLPDAPSYSAVRATLRVLEEKGHLRHEDDRTRYFYLPTVPLARARKSALKSVVDTFFDGSVERVVAALMGREELSEKELAKIAALIDQARKDGR